MVEPQNYIFVMCDDLGYGDTGFNGNKIIKTPYLDQLAGEGVILSRFYASSPVCSPTRASCLSGRHPFRVSVFYANQGILPKEEIILPNMVKTKGYTTGFFGKWHLGSMTTKIHDSRRGTPGGTKLYNPPWEHDFDTVFAAEAQMPLWNPMINQRHPSKYWKGEDDYETENLDGANSRVIMDRAIPFIEDAVDKKKPFLAMVWFHTPHEPVRAGPEYRAMYSEYSESKQHYYGAITAMDEQVGRLNQKLKDLKIDKNTMVWFCSDNGPETNRNSHGVTMGLRGRKRSLFNGGVQVPAVLKWPKYTDPMKKEDKRLVNNRFSFPLSTLDYFPTIQSDIGFTIPDDRPLDGIDASLVFTEKLKNRPIPIPFRSFDRKKAMAGSPGFALINNDYKMLTNYSNNTKEDMVFNLIDDEGEKSNIVNSNADFFRESKEYLLKLLKSFKNSHAGGDYPESHYTPVNEYISNKLGWNMTQNSKTKRRLFFRKK